MTREELDSLWDFSDPEKSRSSFENFLLKPGLDDDLKLQIQTQIARTLGLQGRFDDAATLLQEVERELSVGDSVARIRWNLEWGRVLNSSGSPSKSRPFFETALQVAEMLYEDDLAIDAAHMIAIVSEGDEQLNWNEKAIAMALASDRPRARRWLASLYNNLGWTVFDRGEYSRALELFEAALTERRKRDELEPLNAARWCVARAKRALGRVHEALQEQRALEAESNDNPSRFICEEIAACLTELGKPEEAAPYLAKAREHQ